MSTAGATVGGEDDEGCCRTKWDAGTHHSLTPPPSSICGPKEDGSGFVGDAWTETKTWAHVQI